MTREDEKIYEYLEYDLCGDEIDNSVLKLQVEAVKRYLQSRICENCKHLDKSLSICWMKVEIDGYMGKDESFGCNKFERVRR